MKVGVIFGGRSVEHDVSIVTAHQVMAELLTRHEVVPVYVTRDGRWLTGEDLNDLAVYRERRWDDAGREAFIPPVPGYGGLLVPGGGFRKTSTIGLDVVVPAIHGTYGEDGTLQGLLDLADIPYTCSGVVGSAVGMDKVAMKGAFRAVGLPVVADLMIEVKELDAGDAVLDRVEREIGFPCFVKPSRLGSSVGIGKAADRASLSAALDVARRYDRRILIEESKEHCLEINCSVLGGVGRAPQVSVCEQPLPLEEFLTFSDKYMRPGKTGKQPAGMAAQDRRIPAPISDALTKQVQENALAAFKAVDASGVARIDAFVSEHTGDTWVMEINTVPGSFSFYLWKESGKPFGELMEDLIEIALDTHKLRSELMVTYDSGMLESGGPKTRG